MTNHRLDVVKGREGGEEKILVLKCQEVLKKKDQPVSKTVLAMSTVQES